MITEMKNSCAPPKKGEALQYIRYPMVPSEYDRVWTKYCGFLKLRLEQFMSAQESLLLQQLDKVTSCSLWKRLVGHRIPQSIREFRNLATLTVYEDYLPEPDSGNGQALPENPFVWANTSGAAGRYKRVPYTLEAYNRSLDNLMSVLILACSRQKGQSSIMEGDRVLFNVAPPPYLSGLLACGASQIFNLRPVISPDMYDGMDFKEKITKGFEMSLRTGMDILVAMTSVLVKTGNEFNQMSGKSWLSKHIMHPGELFRLSRGYLRSKLENRRMLPKDLLAGTIFWSEHDSVVTVDEQYNAKGTMKGTFSLTRPDGSGTLNGSFTGRIQGNLYTGDIMDKGT